VRDISCQGEGYQSLSLSSNFLANINISNTALTIGNTHTGDATLGLNLQSVDVSSRQGLRKEDVAAELCPMELFLQKHLGDLRLDDRLLGNANNEICSSAKELIDDDTKAEQFFKDKQVFCPLRRTKNGAEVRANDARFLDMRG